MALSLEFIETNEGGNSFSLINGGSVFTDGLVFNITGFTFKKRSQNGVAVAKANPCPVFVTNVSNNGGFADLFVSMVVRTKRTYDLEEIKSEGTFSDYVRQAIADAKKEKEDKDKTDEAILQKIVDGCKEKSIIVSRRAYKGFAADGSQVARSIVDFNFTDKK